ncbi:hypothetical protein BCR39DRAFT_588323 [Naematelia encephala]|uniref:Uncharacterized protein n=1 Tax=Naematelia encephala TaxID=71784 RepID=A0A1Y2B4S1_9TREE|nr:hypothetical protein BCR39DRAFT_588323 [Naematelia encephala]
MLTFAVLFSILTIIASAKPLPMPAKLAARSLAPAFYQDTPCWENGRAGLLHDAICIAINVGDDGSAYPDNTPCWLDGRYGLVHDTLCVAADIDLGGSVYRRYTWPYTGYFVDGDQCWLDGWTGTVHNSACVVGDLNVGILKRAPFDHYVSPILAGGDKCWKDGREGVVQNAVCVVADVQIGINGGQSIQPYYRYPYGLTDGAQCWKGNVQGFVKNALCVVADVNLSVTKRRFTNGPFFKDDTPCYQDGKLGLLKDAVCVLADVKISKRLHDPHLIEGSRCWRDGHEGLIRDALCVIAGVDVALNKRFFTTASSVLNEHDACWENGHQGIVRDALCVVADVKVNKRLLGLLDGHRSAIAPDGHDDLLDTAAVVGLKRNLLAPAALHGLTGNLVKGVDNLDKPVLRSSSQVRKDLLGLGGLTGDSAHPGGALASVAAVLDVSDGHHKGLLGLKRGILGGNDDLVADVEALVDVDVPKDHHGALSGLGLRKRTPGGLGDLGLDGLGVNGGLLNSLDGTVDNLLGGNSGILNI